MKNQKPYDKVWALLSRDTDGNEGICMLNGPVGPVLAVTGTLDVLEMYKRQISTDQAKAEILEAGVSVVVGEFTRTGTEALDDDTH